MHAGTPFLPLSGKLTGIGVRGLGQHHAAEVVLGLGGGGRHLLQVRVVVQQAAVVVVVAGVRGGLHAW